MIAFWIAPCSGPSSLIFSTLPRSTLELAWSPSLSVTVAVTDTSPDASVIWSFGVLVSPSSCTPRRSVSVTTPLLLIDSVNTMSLLPSTALMCWLSTATSVTAVPVFESIRPVAVLLIVSENAVEPFCPSAPAVTVNRPWKSPVAMFEPEGACCDPITGMKLSSTVSVGSPLVVAVTSGPSSLIFRTWPRSTLELAWSPSLSVTVAVTDTSPDASVIWSFGVFVSPSSCTPRRSVSVTTPLLLIDSVNTMSLLPSTALMCWLSTATSVTAVPVFESIRPVAVLLIVSENAVEPFCPSAPAVTVNRPWKSPVAMFEPEGACCDPITGMKLSSTVSVGSPLVVAVTSGPSSLIFSTWPRSTLELAWSPSLSVTVAVTDTSPDASVIWSFGVLVSPSSCTPRRSVSVTTPLLLIDSVNTMSLLPSTALMCWLSTATSVTAVPVFESIRPVAVLLIVSENAVEPFCPSAPAVTVNRPWKSPVAMFEPEGACCDPITGMKLSSTVSVGSPLVVAVTSGPSSLIFSTLPRSTLELAWSPSLSVTVAVTDTSPDASVIWSFGVLVSPSSCTPRRSVSVTTPLLLIDSVNTMSLLPSTALMCWLSTATSVTAVPVFESIRPVAVLLIVSENAVEPFCPSAPAVTVNRPWKSPVAMFEPEGACCDPITGMKLSSTVSVGSPLVVAVTSGPSSLIFRTWPRSTLELAWSPSLSVTVAVTDTSPDASVIWSFGVFVSPSSCTPRRSVSVTTPLLLIDSVNTMSLLPSTALMCWLSTATSVTAVPVFESIRPVAVLLIVSENAVEPFCPSAPAVTVNRPWKSPVAMFEPEGACCDPITGMKLSSTVSVGSPLVVAVTSGPSSLIFSTWPRSTLELAWSPSLSVTVAVTDTSPDASVIWSFGVLVSPSSCTPRRSVSVTTPLLLIDSVNTMSLLPSTALMCWLSTATSVTAVPVFESIRPVAVLLIVSENAVEPFCPSAPAVTVNRPWKSPVAMFEPEGACCDPITGMKLSSTVSVGSPLVVAVTSGPSSLIFSTLPRSTLELAWSPSLSVTVAVTDTSPDASVIWSFGVLVSPSSCTPRRSVSVTTPLLLIDSVNTMSLLPSTALMCWLSTATSVTAVPVFESIRPVAVLLIVSENAVEPFCPSAPAVTVNRPWKSPVAMFEPEGACCDPITGMKLSSTVSVGSPLVVAVTSGPSSLIFRTWPRSTLELAWSPSLSVTVAVTDTSPDASVIWSFGVFVSPSSCTPRRSVSVTTPLLLIDSVNTMSLLPSTALMCWLSTATSVTAVPVFESIRPVAVLLIVSENAVEPFCPSAPAVTVNRPWKSPVAMFEPEGACCDPITGMKLSSTVSVGSPLVVAVTSGPSSLIFSTWPRSTLELAWSPSLSVTVAVTDTSPDASVIWSFGVLVSPSSCTPRRSVSVTTPLLLIDSVNTMSLLPSTALMCWLSTATSVTAVPVFESIRPVAVLLIVSENAVEPFCPSAPAVTVNRPWKSPVAMFEPEGACCDPITGMKLSSTVSVGSPLVVAVTSGPSSLIFSTLPRSTLELAWSPSLSVTVAVTDTSPDASVIWSFGVLVSPSSCTPRRSVSVTTPLLLIDSVNTMSLLPSTALMCWLSTATSVTAVPVFESIRPVAVLLIVSENAVEPFCPSAPAVTVNRPWKSPVAMFEPEGACCDPITGMKLSSTVSVGSPLVVAVTSGPSSLIFRTWPRSTLELAWSPSLSVTVAVTDTSPDASVIWSFGVFVSPSSCTPRRSVSVTTPLLLIDSVNTMSLLPSTALMCWLSTATSVTAVPVFESIRPVAVLLIVSENAVEPFCPSAPAVTVNRPWKSPVAMFEPEGACCDPITGMKLSSTVSVGSPLVVAVTSGPSSLIFSTWPRSTLELAWSPSLSVTVAVTDTSPDASVIWSFGVLVSPSSCTPRRSVSVTTPLLLIDSVNTMSLLPSTALMCWLSTATSVTAVPVFESIRPVAVLLIVSENAVEPFCPSAPAVTVNRPWKSPVAMFEPEGACCDPITGMKLSSTVSVGSPLVVAVTSGPSSLIFSTLPRSTLELAWSPSLSVTVAVTDTSPDASVIWSFGVLVSPSSCTPRRSVSVTTPLLLIDSVNTMSLLPSTALMCWLSTATSVTAVPVFESIRPVAVLLIVSENAVEPFCPSAPAVTVNRPWKSPVAMFEPEGACCDPITGMKLSSTVSVGSPLVVAVTSGPSSLIFSTLPRSTLELAWSPSLSVTVAVTDTSPDASVIWSFGVLVSPSSCTPRRSVSVTTPLLLIDSVNTMSLLPSTALMCWLSTATSVTAVPVFESIRPVAVLLIVSENAVEPFCPSAPAVTVNRPWKSPVAMFEPEGACCDPITGMKLSSTVSVGSPLVVAVTSGPSSLIFSTLPRSTLELAWSPSLSVTVAVTDTSPDASVIWSFGVLVSPSSCTPRRSVSVTTPLLLIDSVNTMSLLPSTALMCWLSTATSVTAVPVFESIRPVAVLLIVSENAVEPFCPSAPAVTVNRPWKSPVAMFEPEGACCDPITGMKLSSTVSVGSPLVVAVTSGPSSLIFSTLPRSTLELAWSPSLSVTVAVTDTSPDASVIWSFGVLVSPSSCTPRRSVSVTTPLLLIDSVNTMSLLPSTALMCWLSTATSVTAVPVFESIRPVAVLLIVSENAVEPFCPSAPAVTVNRPWKSPVAMFEPEGACCDPITGMKLSSTVSVGSPLVVAVTSGPSSLIFSTRPRSTLELAWSPSLSVTVAVTDTSPDASVIWSFGVLVSPSSCTPRRSVSVTTPLLLIDSVNTMSLLPSTALTCWLSTATSVTAVPVTESIRPVAVLLIVSENAVEPFCPSAP